MGLMGNGLYEFLFNSGKSGTRTLQNGVFLSDWKVFTIARFVFVLRIFHFMIATYLLGILFTLMYE